MARDDLESEIERARRVSAMLTSAEDKAAMDRYISDLLRMASRDRGDRRARPA